MNAKHPVSILKRKVTNKIVYKILWDQGTITYEPMVELTPEMLKLVQDWELANYKKENQKVVDDSSTLKKKSDKLEDKINATVLQHSPVQIAIQPHKPKPSQIGFVKSIRIKDGRVECFIMTKDEGIQRWADKEEVKAILPYQFCDYLLQKVKFTR